MSTLTVALDAEHTRQSNAGIARYAWHLASALNEIGGVTLIELGGGALEERGTLGKRVTTLRQDFIWYLWRGRSLARRASAAVYHSPLPRGPLTKGTPPFVVTVHDLAQVRYPATLTPYSRLYSALTLASILNAADRIIAPSNDTANDLNVLLHVSADRIRVVPNGVDARFFVDEGEHRGTQSDRYVLFVGTPEPRKNLERLVAAVDLLRKEDPLLQLWIAGGHGWGPQPGDSAAIRKLGRVSDGELGTLYSRALCLAMPSLHEGFGLPVLEAMAAGTAVVTSMTGALPEVAGEAAVLVDPLDVRSIADGIRRAIAERDHLIAKGRAHAKSFTWQRTARETLSVYRELA